MPFWRSYAHLVWTTRNREPLIRPEIEAPLYACLIDKAAAIGCYVHAVNGIADHVHLIISIPPRISVSDVVKNLKGNSSHFVNHVLPAGPEPFSWQRGYGYLTLGESQCARAIAYVENQKQHHRANTTNSWLEKVDEDAEQSDASTDTASATGLVREERASYGILDEPKF